MKITKLSINCDLSETSLEEAARLLPPSKLYRLQIHVNLLTVARDIVIPAHEGPLTPTITIEIAPFEKQDHWAIWSGDECVWSPGA